MYTTRRKIIWKSSGHYRTHSGLLLQCHGSLQRLSAKYQNLWMPQPCDLLWWGGQPVDGNSQRRGRHTPILRADGRLDSLDFVYAMYSRVRWGQAVAVTGVCEPLSPSKKRLFLSRVTKAQCWLQHVGLWRKRNIVAHNSDDSQF